MTLRISWAAPVLLLALAGCDSSDAVKPPATSAVVIDLAVGTGAMARSGDTLAVRYVARFVDGTEFDREDDSFRFTLGARQVITGWDLGIPGMRVGGVRRLVIPPEEAYGATGVPPIIPPNATLVFDVTLIELHAPVRLPIRHIGL